MARVPALTCPRVPLNLSPAGLDHRADGAANGDWIGSVDLCQPMRAHEKVNRGSAHLDLHHDDATPLPVAPARLAPGCGPLEHQRPYCRRRPSAIASRSRPQMVPALPASWAASASTAFLLFSPSRAWQ